MKILKTSILNFAPSLKLHHVVIIENKSDLYSIDFSPINQTFRSTQLKLLFGQNVPAEIRFRKIENVSFHEDNQIIEKWISKLENNYDFSQMLSDETYNNVNDIIIKKYMNDIKLWNKNMNLYNHNCQHFSRFSEKLYLYY